MDKTTQRKVKSLNIIISCCGTRNNIVRYFKRELNGKGTVIATDCSPLAPALYEADVSCVVSRIDSPAYINELLDLCRKHHVDAIISLLDPELLLLAEHRRQFLDIGVIPIVSGIHAIATSFDKFKMNIWLAEHGFPALKTYLSAEEFKMDHAKKNIEFPVYVKPRCGSGSVDTYMVFSMEELTFRIKQRNDFLIQECVTGIEYAADAYGDMLSHKPVSFFLKRKLRKRDGETDKCISAEDDSLRDQIFRFIEEFGLAGPLDFDVVHSNGLYYIIDVNPRFGGGYPIAFSHGINFFEMILNNLSGKANTFKNHAYEPGVYSMKYYETMTRKEMAEKV